MSTFFSAAVKTKKRVPTTSLMSSLAFCVYYSNLTVIFLLTITLTYVLQTKNFIIIPFIYTLQVPINVKLLFLILS